MKRTITYAVTTATQEITQAEYNLVRTLYENIGGTRTIAAIKFIREQYGLGLLEAKRICDAIVAAPDDRADA